MKPFAEMTDNERQQLMSSIRNFLTASLPDDLKATMIFQCGGSIEVDSQLPAPDAIRAVEAGLRLMKTAMPQSPNQDVLRN